MVSPGTKPPRPPESAGAIPPSGADQSPGSRPGLETPRVRRKLAALFGDSLFGPWPELEQYGDLPDRGPVIPRRRRWPRRLALLLGFAGVAAAAVALLGPGLERHAADERGRYAEELALFLRDGNLERAAEFLPLARGEGPLAPDDPTLDVIVRAEAMLYRYWDADPLRLERIRAHLDGAPFGSRSSPQRTLATLAVLSSGERAEHLPLLKDLSGKLPRDADAQYLVTTSLVQHQQWAAAREAWKRSEDLGPLWFGQRFEQAVFECQQGRPEAATKLVRSMVRADAGRPWASLAAKTCALPASVLAEAPRAPEAGAVPLESRVLVHHTGLVEGLLAARRGDLGLARRHLSAAAAAINQQSPFLLDAFDWLLRGGAPELALELTKLPGWPRGAPAAEARLRLLSERRAPP